MTDAQWHTDPAGRFHQRYFDGTRWTEHVVDSTGAQSVDPVGVGDASPEAMEVGAGRAADPSEALDADTGPGGSPAGGPGVVIGAPPDRQASPWEAGPGPAPAPAGQNPWGDAGPGGVGAWPPSGPGGAAPPARKMVDKLSVVGLVLAGVGIAVGLVSLFVLPWLDVAGTDVDFSDARQGVDDTGVFGAVAAGLMINIAYYAVAVGGAVAVAKALGSRTAGLVGLALAVIGLVALIVVGVVAIPVEEGDPSVAGSEVSTTLQSDGEDRLAQTAVFTGVVMVISTVMVAVGLLLHGIAGRILTFLGLGLIALFTLGGIFVLKENYTDLTFGFASVDLSLGAFAIVAAALLLAISSAIPGGRKPA